MHECFCPGKRAVNDVDVVDFGPTQHESEAYVPFCLQACTEDCDGMDTGAAAKDDGRCERSTESCHFLRIEEGVGYASRCKQR